jgi:hypothetical protein
MTTEIKVYAHCAADTEVHIMVADPALQEGFVLQDGESKEGIYVYDARQVIVVERKRMDK